MTDEARRRAWFILQDCRHDETLCLDQLVEWRANAVARAVELERQLHEHAVCERMLIAYKAGTQPEGDVKMLLDQIVAQAVRATAMCAAEFFSHEIDSLGILEQVEMADKIALMADEALRCEPGNKMRHRWECGGRSDRKEAP